MSPSIGSFFSRALAKFRFMLRLSTDPSPPFLSPQSSPQRSSSHDFRVSFCSNPGMLLTPETNWFGARFLRIGGVFRCNRLGSPQFSRYVVQSLFEFVRLHSLDAHGEFLVAFEELTTRKDDICCKFPFNIGSFCKLRLFAQFHNWWFDAVFNLLMMNFYSKVNERSSFLRFSLSSILSFFLSGFNFEFAPSICYIEINNQLVLFSHWINPKLSEKCWNPINKFETSCSAPGANNSTCTSLVNILFLLSRY